MSKFTPTTAGPTAAAIVLFWREAGRERWFRKDNNFDRALTARFHSAHIQAAERQFDHWNVQAEGALALQILLDQLPRNVYRGNAHAYATDSLALSYALSAINAGLDQQIDPSLRMFCYMSLMHSENLAMQQRCVDLFKALGGDALEHAVEHRDIIERFGRFPHRNRVLGRITTPDEQQFLDAGGFAG